MNKLQLQAPNMIKAVEKLGRYFFLAVKQISFENEHFEQIEPLTV